MTYYDNTKKIFLNEVFPNRNNVTLHKLQLTIYLRKISSQLYKYKTSQKYRLSQINMKLNNIDNNEGALLGANHQ